MQREFEEATGDRFDLSFNPTTRDITCRRDPDGRCHFNLTPRDFYHHGKGWGWGYAGSGAAEFALHIMELFCAPLDQTPPTKLFRGRCSHLAWALHQEFKFEFIATLPKEGGTIRGREIAAWVERHRAEASAPLLSPRDPLHEGWDMV